MLECSRYGTIWLKSDCHEVKASKSAACPYPPDEPIQKTSCCLEVGNS